MANSTQKSNKNPEITIQKFDDFLASITSGTHKTIHVSNDGKQRHLVWTNQGLLVFVPKKGSRAYINSPEEKEEIEKSKAIQPTQWNKTFDDFEEHQLYKWNVIADDLKLLIDGAIEMVRRIKSEINSKDRKVHNNMLFSGTQQFNRQIKFILTGMLMNGVIPPLELYQHLIEPLSLRTIAYGQNYPKHFAGPYSKIASVGMLISTMPIIDGLTIFKGAREYASTHEVSNATGNSALLSFGNRNRSDTKRWAEFEECDVDENVSEDELTFSYSLNATATKIELEPVKTEDTN